MNDTTVHAATDATARSARGGPRAGLSRTARIALSVAAVALIAAGTVATASAASPVASAPSAPAAGTHRFCVAEWQAATTSKTIEALRAVGDCEINRRIVTLDALDTRVAGAPAITGTHKSQLRSVNGVNPASIAAEKAGLQALKTKIDGETDVATLRADISKIAEDYRVYVLVVPKAHLTGGSDAVDAAATKLTEMATKLQGLIDKAKANGKDVIAAQAALDDMKAKTSQADALNTPVVGSIMGLSPADSNGGTAGPALGSARTTIGQARDLLKAARADAKTIIDSLKG